MTRHFLTLTAAQREELIEHRDHDSRPFVRERCAAVLKVADGLTPPQVAQCGLLRPRQVDTVYSWLRLYEQHGLAGLLQHPQGGNRKRSLCRA